MINMEEEKDKKNIVWRIIFWIITVVLSLIILFNLYIAAVFLFNISENPSAYWPIIISHSWPVPIWLFIIYLVWRKAYKKKKK